MQYRRLGRTGQMISLMGIGGGYVMLQDIDTATKIYERAADLGINYFDGRYGYTSSMQRPVINRDRAHFMVGSKTASTSGEEVLKRVDEDLKELGSDYIDIYYLRTYTQEMMSAHLAPGGSIEGLLKAREQGKIRFLALAGHTDLAALARGAETGLIDVVQFPLNVVRRDAYDVLIPTLIKHDIGMVIMKPVNTGLVPAEVCLPWLANQPIHCMIPGIANMEHLELDVAALERDPMALSPAEEAEAERWRAQMDHNTCRICDRKCQPVCEPGLLIDWLLYHNVFQNELRRLGPQGYVQAPFAPWIKEHSENIFRGTIGQLQACTACGKCEEVCPHHLPIIQMIKQMEQQEIALVDEIQKSEWAQAYHDSQAPMSKKTLSSWASGGKKDKPKTG